MKVFLGGAYNSEWRKEFIHFLEYEKIDYYNPVITGRDWTSQDEDIEEKQKVLCDKLLWVFTPDMLGFYSVYELTVASLLYPRKLIFVLEMKGDCLNNGFFKIWTDKQIRSWDAIRNRLIERGVVCFTGLLSTHSYFRSLKEISRDV